MFSSDFYQMLEKVEGSYEGFKVFKSGSRLDKFLFSLCILFFCGASVFMCWGNFCSENIIMNLSSLILFIIVLITFFIFINKLQRRENFFYKKGQTKEEELYNQFIQYLSKNGVNESLYPKIIAYYNNKIHNDESINNNFVVNYFICFLIPVIISFCEKNKVIQYLLIFGIIGLIIIPGIFFHFG